MRITSQQDAIIGASSFLLVRKVMNAVTQILSQIEQGDPSAAEELPAIMQLLLLRVRDTTARLVRTHIGARQKL